jgi:hypothetical protein
MVGKFLGYSPRPLFLSSISRVLGLYERVISSLNGSCSYTLHSHCTGIITQQVTENGHYLWKSRSHISKSPPGHILILPNCKCRTSKAIAIATDTGNPRLPHHSLRHRSGCHHGTHRHSFNSDMLLHLRSVLSIANSMHPLFC